ncbi:MAG: hypothetical protein K8S54_21585 [Spirochaetia bacterium]|nr:hypothetical protein [Spirochaetia bacterium]
MLQRLLLITLLASPLMAESTHKFLLRGLAAPGVIKPADTQEDYHTQPLIAALLESPGSLLLPTGDDSYKCPKSFKPKLDFAKSKEDGGSEERSTKPGCGSVPLGVEAEYRFKDALRLSYSRFNIPSSNYRSSFISPILASNLVGADFSDYEYHLHQTRTKYGAVYAHPITEWLSAGPGVSAVKEFYHYELSPNSSGFALISPRGYFFSDTLTIGQRERVLSGSAPGMVIEATVNKNVKLYANYERFVLKGSSIENTMGVGLGYISVGTASAAGLFIGGLNTVSQKLEHSGHETTLGVRLGLTDVVGFHLAFTDRKFVRNITEYTAMNSVLTYYSGVQAALLSSLSLGNVYRWHRYVQSGKYIVMKMEIGVGF